MSSQKNDPLYVTILLWLATLYRGCETAQDMVSAKYRSVKYAMMDTVISIVLKNWKPL